MARNPQQHRMKKTGGGVAGEGIREKIILLIPNWGGRTTVTRKLKQAPATTKAAAELSRQQPRWAQAMKALKGRKTTYYLATKGGVAPLPVRSGELAGGGREGAGRRWGRELEACCFLLREGKRHRARVEGRRL